MRRCVVSALMLLLLAGGSVACGASTALTTKYETPGSLAGHPSYAFAATPGLEEQGFTSGHLFNPIMQRRIRDELSKELTARGYKEAPPDQASLLITFSAGGREDVVTPGNQQGTEVRGLAYTVDRGALVLHVLEARDKNVVWRGWGEGVLTSSADLDVAVRQAVREIMKPFPPYQS